MTVEIQSLADLIVAAQVAVWIAGGAFGLMGLFFLYLLVRPARGQAAERETVEPAEMAALVERIERRLELLERAVENDGLKSGGAPRGRRVK